MANLEPAEPPAFDIKKDVLETKPGFFFILFVVNLVLFFIVSNFIDDTGSLSNDSGTYALNCVGVFAVLWLCPFKKGTKVIIALAGILFPCLVLTFGI